MDEITLLQAEVLKTLASPRRLAILHSLADGPRGVGELAMEVRASQSNVSQHLAILRSAGLVEAERDGREVRYHLVDADVVVACAIMRTVLERRLIRLAALLTKPATKPVPKPATTPATTPATKPVTKPTVRLPA